MRKLIPKDELTNKQAIENLHYFLAKSAYKKEFLIAKPLKRKRILNERITRC